MSCAGSSGIAHRVRCEHTSHCHLLHALECALIRMRVQRCWTRARSGASPPLQPRFVRCIAYATLSARSAAHCAPLLCMPLLHVTSLHPLLL